jgi:tRNA pseudouridine32 synthase/23S rRNA pseudouridine746 synthase
VQLPREGWRTVLAFLCERFAHVPAATWEERMARGLVVDDAGGPLSPHAPFRAGLRVHYWREVAVEPSIAGVEQIVHVDDDLVVADKPAFLPVAPTGAWVAETLLARLRRRLGIPGLAPLHRLDRATAGLVMFSVRTKTRAAYHALFAERQITKRYLARAPALAALTFPYTHRSRLVTGTPFFRMQETAGTPNSETRIEVVARDETRWRYRLEPLTGRKHQLRVHMAALGAALDGDPYYPTLLAHGPDDPSQPLALLAAQLSFTDPVTGARREFDTTLPPP